MAAKDDWTGQVMQKKSKTDGAFGVSGDPLKTIMKQQGATAPVKEPKGDGWLEQMKGKSKPVIGGSGDWITESQKGGIKFKE